MISFAASVSIVVATFAIACARPRDGAVDSSPSQGVSGDTVRGIVAVLGTDRDRRVVVREGGRVDAPPVRLSGAEAEILGKAAGTDVWVSGTRSPDGGFEVRRFVVRAVDGQPAIDGTIATDGDEIAVVTADGRRHRIVAAPRALRDAPGARVWITGRLETGAVIFGFITKPTP